MTIYFRWRNYGFHLWLNEYDFSVDMAHTWGYRFWWKKFEPRIEERWHFGRWGDSHKFEWELKKNGKSFDGFCLQGPLIRFGAKNT